MGTTRAMAFDRTGTEVERAYRDGEHVVREGEDGREMFVIKRGAVRITKRIGERDVALATLEKGDFFGEMGLLESVPRDANALAVGDTLLLVIQPGGLLMRIRRDPTFAFEMLHKLSGRLRAQNARLIKAIELADEDGEVDERARAVLMIGAGEEPGC